MRYITSFSLIIGKMRNNLFDMAINTGVFETNQRRNLNVLKQKIRSYQNKLDFHWAKQTA